MSDIVNDDFPVWPNDFTVVTTTGRYVTIPLSTIAESGTEVVSVNTGNLAPGTAVYSDGGVLMPASCDPAESQFVGFVLEEGKLQIGGAFNMSVTPGATYYLSPAPGAISTDYPTATGQAIVRVGYAISASLLKIDYQEICIL